MANFVSKIDHFLTFFVTINLKVEHHPQCFPWVCAMRAIFLAWGLGNQMISKWVFNDASIMPCCGHFLR